ncbi:hypothetical protein I6F35_37470 [Bradyrhizobium sp. BRP22]|uniref:hypothetical protein n=1 Tax=Bradyrhizobium sp. BRP22 TaxID=2793821 RepID=UPI001CD60964|nr:hypothetical protein [Bradyrhizobium sp. BRP22]MCA1458788.1 hypothetical protein [Bradyrhizobium sp. BRP22]
MWPIDAPKALNRVAASHAFGNLWFHCPIRRSSGINEHDGTTKLPGQPDELYFLPQLPRNAFVLARVSLSKMSQPDGAGRLAVFRASCLAFGMRGDACDEGSVMNKDQPLKPDDFPLDTEDEKLRTHKGRDIAIAESEKVAERVNEQAHREEQDRWSA